jgi:E2F-associated phosphoprotein
MGITVDWQSRLIYDEDQELLVPQQPLDHQNRIPEELNDTGKRNDFTVQCKEGEYFPVLCGNCRTQVAALDMIEEVYHFHGCLESS